MMAFSLTGRGKRAGPPLGVDVLTVLGRDDAFCFSSTAPKASALAERGRVVFAAGVAIATAFFVGDLTRRGPRFGDEISAARRSSSAPKGSPPLRGLERPPPSPPAGRFLPMSPVLALRFSSSPNGRRGALACTSGSPCTLEAGAGAAEGGEETSGKASGGAETSGNTSGGVDTVVGDGLLEKAHFDTLPEEAPEKATVEAGVDATFEAGVETGVEAEVGESDNPAWRRGLRPVAVAMRRARVGRGRGLSGNHHVHDGFLVARGIARVLAAHSM